MRTYGSLVKAFRHFLYRAVVSIYPGLASREVRNSKIVSPSQGIELFDRQEYLDINNDRMTHLQSLGLPIEEKTVLDVGCGVGHLAQFFVNKGCEVVCVDGRSENIDKLRSRYPRLHAYVADVETTSLYQFGTFDVVFCYGLLYHLENPIAVLRNISSATKNLLLLETMICDSSLPLVRVVDEKLTPTQALHGIGCRPSPSYIAMALNRVGFRFVYTPKVPPKHPQFQFKWKNNLDWRRDGHPLRCIFVASRAELQNPNLTSLLKRLR